jgi:hypothetical protein
VRWLLAEAGENGEKGGIQPVHALKEEEGGWPGRRATWQGGGGGLASVGRTCEEGGRRSTATEPDTGEGSR